MKDKNGNSFDYDALQKRIQQHIPEVVRQKLKDQLATNMKEFMADLQQTTPQDTGDLLSTLKFEQLTDLQVRVTIGDKDHPATYVEHGHKEITKSGKRIHVPAHPFFWPTWRVVKKKFKARMRSAFKKGAGQLTINPPPESE